MVHVAFAILASLLVGPVAGVVSPQSPKPVIRRAYVASGHPKDRNIFDIYSLGGRSHDPDLHALVQINESIVANYKPLDAVTVDTVLASQLSNPAFGNHLTVIAFVVVLMFGFAAGLALNLDLVTVAWTRLQRASSAIAACAAFMLISPALIALNKYILQDLSFSYPLSLSGLGLLSSAVTSHTLVYCGLVSVRAESLEVVRGTNLLKVALPIGACKALTLASGNAAYLYLGLSFIQMLKALVPVFVLFFMRIVGMATPSHGAVACVLIIVLGTFLEVRGEMHATAVGLLLMFLSVAAEALSLVLTQLCLQDKRLTVIEGLYTLTPLGALSLFVFAAALEGPAMWKQGGLQIVVDQSMSFLGAAVLGVLVNFLGFLVVQCTSALTSKILNTVRSIGLVALGVLYYGEEATVIELCGYAISFFGLCGYSYIQSIEGAIDGECKALSKNQGVLESMRGGCFKPVSTAIHFFRGCR